MLSATIRLFSTISEMTPYRFVIPLTTAHSKCCNLEKKIEIGLADIAQNLFINIQNCTFVVGGAFWPPDPGQFVTLAVGRERGRGQQAASVLVPAAVNAL